jgi:hypothetical protein
MSKVKFIFGCFLVSILILTTSCENGKKTESKNENQTKVVLPQIDGFYLFKRGMTFYEVSKILDERKIRYRFLNLENYDEVNYPISWKYVINSSDLAAVKAVKVIEGFSLPILDKYFDRFQISFFNDTIFYFNYQRKRDSEHISDSGFKKENTFSKDVREDLELLKVLSEGLNYKYGYPYERRGNLNAFFPSTSPFFSWNDDVHRGSQFYEREIWRDRDSTFHIFLQSYCVRDSSNQPPYETKTEGINSVEVLFNYRFADYIQQFVNQRIELESSLKTRRLDSLAKRINRRFDSL